MSSDEGDSDPDYLYYDDDYEYYDYNDYDDVKPRVREVEIKEDGDNSVVVTWDSKELDTSTSSYKYSVKLCSHGKSLDDGKVVSKSPIRFESLERFKIYSAVVEVIGDGDDFVEDDGPIWSELILLGAKQFDAVVNELRKYPYALETMIAQEKDEETSKKMNQILRRISDLDAKYIFLNERTRLPSEEILYYWGEHKRLPSEETVTKYKEQVQKWFNEKSPLLPNIEGLQTLVGKEGITVKWDTVAWPNDLQYTVQVYCTQVEYGEAKLVGDGSFLIDSPDPTKKFHVEVWSVDGEKTGKRSKSDEIMICKDLGKVLVDCTKPIREGYRVYEGYMKGASGKLDKVAVKIVNSTDAKQLRRELKITEELRAHRNTVLHLGLGDVEDAVEHQAYIVLELCKKDTLHEMVKDSVLKKTSSKIALAHIISGLSHLHGKNILHRDFKPQNILCSLDGKDLKISNFGLSKQAKPDMSKVSKSVHEIGTDGWGSPEHYAKGIEMSDKSDVYSAGLVFFFVLSAGKHAMGENEYQWKANIIEGAAVDYSSLACEDSELAQDLIQKMLQRNPADRLDADKVLQHPFFWDETHRLRFLHERATFFADFTYAKQPKSPGEDTKIQMKKLKDGVHLMETKSGDANWYKRIKECDGIEEKYSVLLDKAANRRWRYNHSCIFHLLRFIRNTHEHFREDLTNVFSTEANVWKFFNGIFPLLFCAVYNVSDDVNGRNARQPEYQPLIPDKKRNIEVVKDSSPPQKIAKI